MPTPLVHKTLSLNGRWDLRSSEWTLEPESEATRIARASRGCISARVPGEVHFDLLPGVRQQLCWVNRRKALPTFQKVL
ncbi:MAG: hypothetical protein GW893_16435 [Armatimonadetes bacterium]|nr:hypothetical protein [Armatimonadota bacterium]PIU61778.1 MAG: hypothetical protein COS85_20320 [Armatimonadetes bacterium CG07_land_8_20_14_0_80_59_28]PJB69646.1 MAG: hypothetical protein CO095_09720 [Armatimonadetes bacterium CG_4_9_14_3_um_filter_58_7]